MSGFNILKVYPELLDIVGLSERDRQHDLLAIFKRDIEDNFDFAFRSWRIYPIKAQGEADMGRLFKHLTCEEIMVECEDGTKYPKRVFEVARSQRLHWINHHIKEKSPLNIDVFTVEEKDSKKRNVIVLEQQRTNAFYLLTAYHLNKDYGEKALLKKMKKRISTPI